MNVVRHDDEVVEKIMTSRTVVLKRFEKKLGVCLDLEEASAIERGCCNEEGASFRGSLRDRHGKDCTRHPQRLKPQFQQPVRHG